jgi:hypothetical protein
LFEDVMMRVLRQNRNPFIWFFFYTSHKLCYFFSFFLIVIFSFFKIVSNFFSFLLVIFFLC